MEKTFSFIKHIIFLLAFASAGALMIHLAPQMDGAAGANGLVPLVHFKTNAFHLWRAYHGLPLIVPLSFSLFLTGFYLLTISHAIESFSAIAATLFVAILLPHIFGQDTVLFTSLCTLPWIILSWESSRESDTFSTLTPLLCGVALALTAQQLSVPLALFLILLMRDPDPKRSLLFIAPCLCAALFIPPPPLPDYPHFARVVPDDGLAGHIMPMAAHKSPIPLVDHQYIKDTFRAVFYYLFSFSLLLSLVHGFFDNKANKNFIPITLGLLVLLAGELLLPEAWRIITPLGVAERVIPGLFFFTLTPLAIGLLVILIALQLNVIHQKWALLWCFAGLGILFLFEHKVTVADPAAAKIYKEWQGEQKVLISPSYAVLRREGLHTLPPKTLHFRSSKSIRDEFLDSANSPQKRYHRLQDKKRSTRWSLKTGRQEGTEMLGVRFPVPITLRGIKLDTGTFPSDFPRGLTISAAPQCTTASDALERYEQLTVISSSPQWLGPIEYTADKFPYYGHQNRVEIHFTGEYAVQCLVIRQTGKAPFDWSIAELAFAGVFPEEVKKTKDKSQQ